MEKAKRLFVQKREAFRVEASSLLREFNENLSLSLQSLQLYTVYDLFGFSESLLEKCRYSVFGEKATDVVSETFPGGERYLAVEYLPGQFDQRASSAEDCVHLIEPEASVSIKSARLLVFGEEASEADLDRIARYFINPVESRRKDMAVLTLAEKADIKPLEDLSGFTAMREEDFAAFCKSHGLAMNTDDLREVVNYFRKEGREPPKERLSTSSPSAWRTLSRSARAVTMVASFCRTPLSHRRLRTV